MKRSLTCAALAAALTLSTLPAFADPAADALKAKMGAAWAGVKSFKTNVAPTAGTAEGNPMAGGTITTTMVLPDKIESAMDMHGMLIKIVVLAGESWMNMNGSGWRKMPGGGNMNAMFKTPDPKAYASQSIGKMLPDEDFNGKKVGAFTGTTTADKEVGESICNYDKTTYLLVRCHNAKATVLFTDFNSPTNVIDVPK